MFLPRTRMAMLPLLLGLGACAQIGTSPDMRATSGAAREAAMPCEPIPSAAPTESETERLNAWLDARYEEQLHFSPISLTMQGRDARTAELDDYSVAAEEARLAWRLATVEALKSRFDYEALSPSGRLSYDLWVYQAEQAEQGRAFWTNEYVFHQMGGPHSFLPTFMINFHDVQTAQDMRDYVSRLVAMERALGQALARARDNAAAGVRPPRFAYEQVIDQSRKVITGAPFTDSDEDAALWADIKAEISGLEEGGQLTPREAEALRVQARDALILHVAPAYQELIAFLEQDLPNTARTASGVSTRPNGEAYYDHRLSVYTTTDMTADEIHELGLSEVERIRGEMLAIKDEVGFEGDLQAFFEHVREADWNYYPNTDEGRQAYLRDAKAAIDNIRERLPDYFGVLPEAELVVKRVEPFRERDGAAQHYYPGTPDGTRPGIYYVHLSDMTAMPKNQLEVIAYHEGLPGHHMQISIAQELDTVPEFRTQAHFGVYIEGWALYSEALAKEMPGTYQDAYSDFGRLTTELWRAVRLVVDTGLHAKGWTEDEAIDYFMKNSPEPFKSIQSEVQRYLVMPGQAVSYKVGMLKIQALRAKAEAELGEDFDLAAFHDTVLTGGAMPLDLLERRVNGWIEETRAEARASTEA